MKKIDILNIWNVLSDINTDTAPIEFKYAVAKNKQLIKDEVVVLQEVNELPPEAAQLETKRKELCIKYALTDEHGTPLVENGTFKINPEYLDEFTKEMNKLKDIYKPVIDALQERIKALQVLLNEKTDPVSFYTVPLNECPANIKQEHLDILIKYMIT